MWSLPIYSRGIFGQHVWDIPTSENNCLFAKRHHGGDRWPFCSKASLDYCIYTLCSSKRSSSSYKDRILSGRCSCCFGCTIRFQSVCYCRCGYKRHHVHSHSKKWCKTTSGSRSCAGPRVRANFGLRCATAALLMIQP